MSSSTPSQIEIPFQSDPIFNRNDEYIDDLVDLLGEYDCRITIEGLDDLKALHWQALHPQDFKNRANGLVSEWVQEDRCGVKVERRRPKGPTSRP